MESHVWHAIIYARCIPFSIPVLQGERPNPVSRRLALLWRRFRWQRCSHAYRAGPGHADCILRTAASLCASRRRARPCDWHTHLVSLWRPNSDTRANAQRTDFWSTSLRFETCMQPVPSRRAVLSLWRCYGCSPNLRCLRKPSFPPPPSSFRVEIILFSYLMLTECTPDECTNDAGVGGTDGHQRGQASSIGNVPGRQDSWDCRQTSHHEGWERLHQNAGMTTAHTQHDSTTACTHKRYCVCIYIYKAREGEGKRERERERERESTTT